MTPTSDIAVTVRSLGKSYRIDHLGAVEASEAAKGGSRGRWPWQGKGPRQRMSSEIFWALRDVDFEVPRGKVFGVIGRNGAGKIIDEVLAVGDLQFQKKCLGKMKDVTGQGRTVLFVSHSLSTVNSLCDTCMLLENGKVTLIGPTDEVTSKYFTKNQQSVGSYLDLSSDPPGDEYCRLLGARLVDRAGITQTYAYLDREIGIEMSYELVRVSSGPIIPNIHFFIGGHYAFVASPASPPNLSLGRHRAIVWIPSRLLNEGTYSVNFAATTISPLCIHFHEQDSFAFEVIEDLHDESRNGYLHKMPGAVRPQLVWEFE